MAITHAFVSAIADGADTSLVRPSNWNADHTIANGTITEAMLLTADNTTNNSSTTKHGFLPKLSNVATQYLDGTGAFSTPAGGATLNGITAATGAVTIASGNNTGIVWNWANTTNSTTCFTFGETSAATGGGVQVNGDVPQALLFCRTLANSTQTPFKVYVRGNFVMGAAATTTQMFFADGTAAAPTIAFTDTNTGMYRIANGRLGLAIAGANVAEVNGNVSPPIFSMVGTYSSLNFANPTYTVNPATTADTGICIADSGTKSVGVAVAGIENSRWSAGLYQLSKGSADAVSYAMNFRKSRGTVASPTVITTGDDLGTLDFFGYVGPTNTYQSAARIVADSTGTISDSATGIGGILRFLAASVGAEPTEIMRLTAATTTGGGWLTMDEADANPGTGDIVAAEEVAMYRKADKLVFAMNIAGVMNYLSIALDGATTAWTQGTTAP